MAEREEIKIPPGLEAAMKALAKVPNIKPITIPNIDLDAFKKPHADALAVFPEIQKRFGATVRSSWLLVALRRHRRSAR